MPIIKFSPQGEQHQDQQILWYNLSGSGKGGVHEPEQEYSEGRDCLCVSLTDKSDHNVVAHEFPLTGPELQIRPEATWQAVWSLF